MQGPLENGRGNTHSAFLRIFVGVTISLFGSGLNAVAVVWLAFASGSAGLVAVVVLVQTLALLGFGVFGGVLADRVNRRRLMILADVARAGAVGGLALLQVAGLLNPAFLIVGAAVVAVLDQLFWPAFRASLPNLVQKEQLARANSWLFAAGSAVAIVAPAVGGQLITQVGIAKVFAVDAVTYLASALAILSVARWRQVRPDARRNVVSDLAEGIAFIIGSRPLRALVAAAVGATLLWGPTPILLVALSDRVLAAGASGFGLIMGGSAAGSLVGALLAGRLARHVSSGMMLSVAYASMGVGSILLGQTTTAYTAAGAAAVRGAANAALNIPALTVLQSETPDELRGRVLGGVQTITECARPVGLLGGAAIVESLGVSTGFLLQGVGLLILGTALASYRPVRSLQ